MTRQSTELFQKGLHLEEQIHFSTKVKPNDYINFLHSLGSSEDEFIARVYASRMQELLEKASGDRPTLGNDPESDLKWECFKTHVEFLNRDPEWFTIYTVPPELRKHYRERRIQLIQEALHSCVSVPSGILEEYPGDLLSVENPPEERTQSEQAGFRIEETPAI